MRILIAVDADTTAITAATTRLFPDAECVVFSAVDLPTMVVPDTAFSGAAAFPPSVEQLDAAEAAAAGVAASAQRELTDADAGETVQAVTAIGDAGPAICEEAETIGADVIVVGRGERSWLSRLFAPSVSDYVVRHAPCPVLVVREGATSDRVANAQAAHAN